MGGREHQRIPYNVQVQFRTASSFLVAYSVNLSRGGLFLEADKVVPVGTEVKLQFSVPGAGPMLIRGRVTWIRGEDAVDGPAGMGLEFEDIGDALGSVIDRLVANFSGLNVLLLSCDDQDRSTLSRLIRSIISTAEVVGASDAHVAEALLGDEIDLAVFELDSDSEAALRRPSRARLRVPPRYP